MSTVGRLWRVLSAPLRIDKVHSPAGSPTHNPASAPTKHVEHAQFDDQLAALLQKNSKIRAGAVQFLGLEKIQEKYASVWDRIADKVDHAARRVIENHLTPDDVFSRMDDGYMIGFASLSIEEAEHCCAMIAEELSNLLMGEERTDQALTVTSIVVEVDGTVSKRRVQGINDLKNIVTEEQRRRESAADRPNKPLRHASMTPEQLSSTPKQPLREPPQPSHGGRTATSRPTTSRGKRAASRVPAARLDLAAAEERKRRQNEFVALLKGTKDSYEFMYEPMWNVAGNVVATYRCIPSQWSEDGDLLVGDEALKNTDDETEIALSWRIHMLDWNCLKRVSEDLERISRDEGINFLAAAPVHISTLADSTIRAEYLELCRSIPDHVRRFLVFELIGVDPQIYHEAMLRSVTTLKPYCRAILLSRPIEHSNFKNVETIGLHSVGPDLSNYSGDEASLQRMMEEFVNQADRSSLKTYICGLSSFSRATAAIGAGFNFIAGSAIALLTDRPSGIVEFQLENLFIPQSATDDLFDSLPTDSGATQEDGATEQMEHDRLNELVGSEEEIALARRFVEVHGLSIDDAMLLAHVKVK